MGKRETVKAYANDDFSAKGREGISAPAGSEFRVPVEIRRPKKNVSKTGYVTIDAKNSVNIFGEGVVIRCKWVNIHGGQLLTAAALEYKETARLTIRHGGGNIDDECVIYRPDTKKYYDIIGCDNVREKNSLIVLNVKRVGNSV